METRSALADAIDRHLEAILGRDLPTLVAGFHPDAVVLLLNGRVVRGREDIEALHADWFADPDWTASFNTVWRLEEADAAATLLSVDYRDVDRRGAPVHLEYLLGLSFVRHGDDWSIMLDQNSLPPR